MRGLAGGAVYTFDVVALNGFGSGLTSTSIDVTPTGPATTYATTVLGDNPSHYFRFSELNGTVRADSSSNGALADEFVHDGGQALTNRSSALPSDVDPAGGFTQNQYFGATMLNGRPTGSSVLPTGNSARTVEAWFKFDQEGADRNLVRWGGDNFHQRFNVGVNRSSVYVENSGEILRVDTPRFLDDQRWHQLMVTYSGSTLTFYLDGQSIGQQNVAQPLNTTATQFFIADGNKYVGDVDEVSIYGQALSASTIAAHFDASGNTRPTAPANVTATNNGDNAVTVTWNASTATVPAGQGAVDGYVVTSLQNGERKQAVATNGNTTSATLRGLSGGSPYVFEVIGFNGFGRGVSGTSAVVIPTGGSQTYATSVLAQNPVAYYRFSEPNGKVFVDSSGNGVQLEAFEHDGGQVIAGHASAVVGESGHSVGFTQNQYFGATWATSIRQTQLPSGSAERTVEAWFRSSDDRERHLVSWGDGNQFGLTVNRDAVGVFSNQGTALVPAGRTVLDGNWHHLVATTDGTTSVKIYLDDSLLGTYNLPAPLNTSAGSLRVADDWKYSGDIDEVAIYNHVLDARTIAERAKNGRIPPSGSGRSEGARS